jgi:hypothetical protein
MSIKYRFFMIKKYCPEKKDYIGALPAFGDVMPANSGF